MTNEKEIEEEARSYASVYESEVGSSVYLAFQVGANWAIKRERERIFEAFNKQIKEVVYLEDYLDLEALEKIINND